MIAAADEIAIPVIVIGEFAFGTSQSRHRDQYARSLERMLTRCTVLTVGIESGWHYAAIRMELKTAGTPIPANDLWIGRLPGSTRCPS